MKFERIATEGGAILYDPTCTGNAAGLFDVDHWRARGALGEAPAGRGSVAFIEDGPRQFVLRRYLRGGLMARVSRDRYLWLGEERTRAFRELRLLGGILDRGLPVPAPVAARYRRTGMTYVAWLVTLRLPGAVSLADRCLEGRVADDDWIAAGRCIRRFHDAGVEHADLNAHNVMLGASGQVWLLDFDRGRLREPGPWRDRVLARLERSLAKISASAPGAANWHAGFALLRVAHDQSDRC